MDLLRRWAFHAATVAVLAGCGHGDVFQGQAPHLVGPFVPGSFARLTYSPGRDQAAAWRPQGGLAYTMEDFATRRRPWCLGVLPDSGGTRLRTDCERSTPDTVIAYDWPAPGGGGRLAYLRAKAGPFNYTPLQWSVMVAGDGDPAHGAPVAAVVFTPAGGPTLDGAEQLRWLDSTRLVYVGDKRFVGSRCSTCAVDTLEFGRTLLLLDRTKSAPPVIIAGTDYATSAAVRSADEVFFTRGGDSHAYRIVVSTGVTTAAWDFGAGVIARDVAIAGDRLVAIVGGGVFFGYQRLIADSGQQDTGGDLAVVDLVGGTQQLIPLPFPVRHPAISADGRRVVVETAARPADLWLVSLP